MKIFSSLLYSLAVGLVLGSCQKKSDPAPQTSKTDLITASSWKLDVAGVDQDKNGTIDFVVTTLIPSCTVDNTILFKRDNTGTTDEGATRCQSTDPQTTTYNWSFADAETNINISNSILTQINGKSKILALSQTSLSLSKDTTISSQNVALIVNLKH
jgi:hypothetical protein